MKAPFLVTTLWFGICLYFPLQAAAQNPGSRPMRKEPVMLRHAEGSFDVKTTPQQPGASLEPTIARYDLDKQYHGDLEAASKGEMLASGNPASGDAGYVAIERVTGALQGRTGSFALQHSGTLQNGQPHLIVFVVPGSGTGDLAGISGALTITIADGAHSYKLDYSLPTAP